VARFAQPEHPVVEAALSKAELLLDLQAVDSKIDRLSKRLAEVKAAQRATDELIAARQAANDAEHIAAQKRSARRDLELADASVDDKIKQADKRLYSGLVKNPKELLDLQNDISSLKRQKATLDDQLLDAMVTLEEAEAVLTRSLAARDQIEAAWKISQSDLIAEQTQLETELARQFEEQIAARAQLSQIDLVLYDQLRRRKGGVAVVEVNGSTCSGCGVRVTAAVLQQLGHADQFTRCGNCERILVRG
jgi:predicted  nucleic acid-binding Zn-ribbon protein